MKENPIANKDNGETQYTLHSNHKWRMCWSSISEEEKRRRKRNRPSVRQWKIAIAFHVKCPHFINCCVKCCASIFFCKTACAFDTVALSRPNPRWERERRTIQASIEIAEWRKREKCLSVGSRYAEHRWTWIYLPNRIVVFSVCSWNKYIHLYIVRMGMCRKEIRYDNSIHL